MKCPARIAALLFLLSLAGCATTPSGPTIDELTRSIGDIYFGKNVREVAARYGIPHEQRDFQAQKVYIWRVTNQKTWRRPVESVTTGTVGRSGPFGSAVPYSMRTTSEQVDTQTYQCTLEMLVDPTEIVRNLKIHGQMGACEVLSPYR